jgi:hypothetical protein
MLILAIIVDWGFFVLCTCVIFILLISFVTMVIFLTCWLYWVQPFSCLPIHFAVSMTDLYLVMRNVPYIGTFVYSGLFT